MMFEAWLDSPGHKETVLDRQWRDIGIGVATGDGDDAAATYTIIFGARKR